MRLLELKKMLDQFHRDLLGYEVVMRYDAGSAEESISNVIEDKDHFVIAIYGEPFGE